MHETTTPPNELREQSAQRRAAEKPVYVHAATLSCVLGRDGAAVMKALSAGFSLVDNGAKRATPAHEGAALVEAAFQAGKIAPADRTAGLAELVELAAPHAHRALAAGIKPEDIALVAGTTTAGLAETISQAAAAPDHAPHPQAWLPMSLGRSAGAAAAVLGLTGPAYVLSTACTAGAKAVAEGARLLRSERVRAAIAGGFDLVNPLTDEGFLALGARTPKGSLPFCTAREGLALGPGGALLLLSTEPVLGESVARLKLVGWGETSDAHHISAPDPTGAGALLAMQTALRSADLAPDDIDFVVLHGTGTDQNDRMEASAVHAVFGDKAPAASLKRAVGHQLAGAGAFAGAVACLLISDTLRTGETTLPLNTPAELPLDLTLAPLALVRSPERRHCRRVLVNAFAFGGSNISLVFEAVDDVKEAKHR